MQIVDVSSVGYLKEGCWRWQSEKGEREIPTKRCCICGEVKEMGKFTIAKGKVRDYCKACRETYKEMHKRKRKQSLRRYESD